MPNVTCDFFLLTGLYSGYLVDTSGYLVLNSGYLIATSRYFRLLLITSRYFWFLVLVTMLQSTINRFKTESKTNSA